MAEYICAARSNRFAVKDKQAFLAWVDEMPGVSAEKMSGERFLLLCEADSGGWPTGLWDPETDKEREVDFPLELSEHLAAGEIAVLLEAGFMKLRAIKGEAVAVNHRGEVLTVSIDDIYEKIEAADWAGHVDRAID